ncbi:MAG: hypothetical protein WDO14_23440 [Bacteroidota bacterium]
MRRLPIILLVIFSMTYQSCDSTLNIDKPNDFYKYIGEDGDQTAVDMVVDADGSAYILGTTNTGNSGLQIYLVKTNTLGEVQWTRTYGDAVDETPKDIEMFSDGTLVVLADKTNAGNNDFVVYFISKADGSETKAHFERAANTTDDHANSITETKDGGFVVAGYVNSGSFKSGNLYRYSNDMITEYPAWTTDINQNGTSFGSGYDVVPVKVVQPDVGVFLTFGYTNTPNGDGNPDYDFFILKTSDLNGNNGGFFSVPGVDVSSNERLTDVKVVPNGGYLLTGYTSSSNGTLQGIYTAWIRSTIVGLDDFTDPSRFLVGDPTKNPHKITLDPAPVGSPMASCFPNSNSEFFILGMQGLNGDNNLYLTKLDSKMSNAWGDARPSRLFGGDGDDASATVAQTPDGRLLVVGTMVLGDLKGQRKIVLMNLSSDGMFEN